MQFSKSKIIKPRGRVQLKETYKVKLKDVSSNRNLRALMFCYWNSTVSVIKINKLLDESTLTQVIDYEDSKRKEDPLPLNHSPP